MNGSQFWQGLAASMAEFRERALLQEKLRSPPRRPWQWPQWINSVGGVLSACRNGFDLVTTFIGRYGDKPIFTLMRDGQIAPRGCLAQGPAASACAIYFGHGMKLPDGTFLYKRKAGK